MFLHPRVTFSSTKPSVKPTVAKFPHNRPITLATSRKCSHCKRQPFFDCRKRSAECRVSFCIREHKHLQSHTHTIHVHIHVHVDIVNSSVGAQLETPTACNKCSLPTQYCHQYTETRRREHLRWQFSLFLQTIAFNDYNGI